MVAEVLSMRKEPATEKNGACMASLSAQNFLFQGQKEDCAMMDQVHKKSNGTILKTKVLVRSLHFL
jgi:hypothetical protein